MGRREIEKSIFERRLTLMFLCSFCQITREKTLSAMHHSNGSKSTKVEGNKTFLFFVSPSQILILIFCGRHRVSFLSSSFFFSPLSLVRDALY